MTALIVGSVLSVLALAFVLWPLVRGAADLRASANVPDLPSEASALDALREIEFDEATGKLSAEDYAALRATYTPLALAELRERDASVGAAEPGDPPARTDGTVDAAEELIARAKQRSMSCATCGPRPEADAWYCSDCGRFLGTACLGCGAQVESERARFCTECGSSLAA
jgi:hypothetical protein